MGQHHSLNPDRLRREFRQHGPWRVTAEERFSESAKLPTEVKEVVAMFELPLELWRSGCDYTLGVHLNQQPQVLDHSAWGTC